VRAVNKLQTPNTDATRQQLKGHNQHSGFSGVAHPPVIFRVITLIT
jgi:hypothetical protein